MESYDINLETADKENFERIVRMPLIERALHLTGKTMEEMGMTINIEILKRKTMRVFSIERFYAYLLSPEFIEKYVPLQRSYKETVIEDF